MKKLRFTELFLCEIFCLLLNERCYNRFGIERIYKESMQTLKGTVIGISNAADERINKTTDQIATGMGQAATATRGDTNSQRESIANRQCPDCNTMNREDRTICSECAADL